MPEVWNSGSQLVGTADAAIGSSGKATRVFNIHIISGGTAAIVSLRNGTSASDTIYLTETGTISTGKTIDYGTKGQLFSNGCFVDVDTNTVSVLVAYSQ